MDSLTEQTRRDRSLVASERLIQSPWATITGVQILATGIHLPERVVRNADLATLGCDEQWIIQRTGIHERRYAAPTESASDLAYEAARQCLNKANVDPRDVDLIVVCTMTPDHPSPSTACLLQHRLGARCGAFDLNAACSGFLYGLVTGAQFVKSGVYQRVLVVGAEVMSRTIDPQDIKTVPLFGDGAGAVLLGPGDASQGLLAFNLGSDGSGACLLGTPGGGSREPLTAEGLAARRQFMRMDGKPVFKWAVRLVAEALLSAMERAGVTSDQVAAVVLHQANERILDAVCNEVGFPRGRMFMNLNRYGNTSAASVPLALHEATEQGKVQPGDLVLCCGFGAGLSWGAALIRY